MPPEEIEIVVHPKDSGGLGELFRHSLSLVTASRMGSVPPFAVLNNFFACGIDDVAGATTVLAQVLSSMRFEEKS